MKQQQRNRLRLYPFLAFDPGVDWQHVNPELLQKLNRLGAQRRVVIDVNSGYRTPAHSVSVGGFADDPHTRGIAVDAYVDGKPVGRVFSAQQFQQAGLITGNQPGFFNGKPDPEHVQLPSGTATAAASPAPAPAVTDTAPTVPATPAAAEPQPVNPILPPAASTGQQPGASAVPAVAAPEPVAGSVADLWRQVTTLPQVSPQTQQLVDNAMAAQGAS